LSDSANVPRANRLPNSSLRAQAAEVLGFPQAAATGVGRGDAGELCAARQRLVQPGQRIADAAHRRVAGHGAAGGDGAVEREVLAAGDAVVAVGAEVAVADPLAVAAVGDADAVGLADVEADEGVEAVLGEAADARGQRTAAGIAVAVAGHAIGRLGDGAGEVVAQDDVDHAGDGIRAIDGRGAVLQHLHPLDRVHRDHAEVGEHLLAIVGQAVGRHAAAIEQHQGRCRAEAAQRDAGAAAGEAGAEALGDGAGAVAGQGLQVLADGGLAGAVDLLAGDHLHRRSGLGGDPWDVGTGDGDAVEVGGLFIRSALRECGRGGDGQRGRDQQQAREAGGNAGAETVRAAGGLPMGRMFHSLLSKGTAAGDRRTGGQGHRRPRIYVFPR